MGADLDSCWQRSGLEADKVLLSFSRVFLLSGERTGDGRQTGCSFLSSSLWRVEEEVWWCLSGPA